MKITNCTYTPNFEARLASDKETRQIFRNFVQDDYRAAYQTFINIDNVSSNDAISIKMDKRANIKNGRIETLTLENIDKDTKVEIDMLKTPYSLPKYFIDSKNTGIAYKSYLDVINSIIYSKNNPNSSKIEKIAYSKLFGDKGYREKMSTIEDLDMELANFAGVEQYEHQVEVLEKENKELEILKARNSKEINSLLNKIDEKKKNYVLLFLA